MAIDIKNQQELEHTLNEIWKFHERVPEFSGTEVDADILLRRLNATDVPITVDNLQQTYEELKWAGLLAPVEDAPEPTRVQSRPEPEVTQVEAPLVDDDAQYDDYEIELAPGVEPEDLSVDGILDSLSPDTLKEMIQRAEQGNAPRRTIDDEIDSLSTAQLGQLITRLSK